ncbi:helix-turn-helix transcriptional regulator [Acetobacteraceae bacterium]|nr:helix-turn-helix transcriptional regulator [Acetobacteraceae bacterium]
MTNIETEFEDFESHKENWDDFDISQDSASISNEFSDFNENALKQHLHSQEAYQEFSLAFLEASMALAAEKGWHGFTLNDVAQEANIPLSWVREHIPTKTVLSKRLNRHIDSFTFRESDTLSSPSLRENLFDLMMRRCDGLQAYRQGFLALLSAIPLTPPLAASFAAGNVESITWIADVAGLNRSGVKGFIRLQALGILWAKILRIWAKDQSEELEETMTALNDGLNKLEAYNLLKPVIAL